MELVKALTHPTEAAAMLRLKLSLPNTVEAQKELSANMRWCYDKLKQTSRSFAVVIQQLGPELRDAVCIFYLVLRGLDTIEDDMNYPAELKQQVLIEFHMYLTQPGYTFSGCGEEHERELLENFDKVIDSFMNLKDYHQEIIIDITAKMGAGMMKYIHRELDSVKDWNEYCHYVAGLVGIGLSRMMAATGLEDQSLGLDEDLSNDMGLFLQKVNITRDFLEDLEEKRVFWPSEIWRQYTNRLDHFKLDAQKSQALGCLNHLITDALELAPSCLLYLSRLRDANNFNFCAIPQVMAIGTLALCYNNHSLFKGVIKLRRGESAKIFLATKGGMNAVYNWFYYYASIIESKIPNDDPNAEKTRAIIKKIKEICLAHTGLSATGYGITEFILGAAVTASAGYLAHRLYTSR